MDKIIFLVEKLKITICQGEKFFKGGRPGGQKNLGRKGRAANE